MYKIAIIGAGNIGRAVAAVVEPKKPRLEFWDKDASRVPGQNDLSAVLARADFVFLCIPSGAVAAAASNIKPRLARKTVVVSIAKGIDAKSGKTTDELLSRILPRQPFALLSGPMLASELSRHMGGSAIIASRSASARRNLAELFAGTELHVETSADVKGIALSGILKNIYAIVLGAAEGMKSGWNAKGLIVSEAMSEMAEIIPLLGGRRGTATCAAGLGDLVATGMSPDSRNHQVGLALARGRSGHLDSEGANSLPFILRRLGSRRKSFPLLLIAAALLARPAHGKTELKNFFAGR